MNKQLELLPVAKTSPKRTKPQFRSGAAQRLITATQSRDGARVAFTVLALLIWRVMLM